MAANSNLALILGHPIYTLGLFRRQIRTNRRSKSFLLDAGGGVSFSTHEQLVGGALHLQRSVARRRPVYGLGNEVKIQSSSRDNFLITIFTHVSRKS